MCRRERAPLICLPCRPASAHDASRVDTAVHRDFSMRHRAEGCSFGASSAGAQACRLKLWWGYFCDAVRLMGTTVKMIAEYLEHALQFEKMAAEESDPALKEALKNQAVAYRKLARERAERQGLPLPPA